MTIALANISKPPLGAPCNGCGLCCQREVCGLGIEVFGEIPAPCPALAIRDGRSWCAVIDAAEARDVAFGAHMKWRLGIGGGCQMDHDHSSPPPSGATP